MEPLAALINQKLMLPSQKTNYIAVEMHYLSQALKCQVGRVFVDEDWYKTYYPDVIEALNSGEIATASQHYTIFGYYEHRMPYRILVDELWYTEEYPDIAAAVRFGTFASGQVHFDELGYREGRIPYPYFRLKLRSDSP